MSGGATKTRGSQALGIGLGMRRLGRVYEDVRGRIGTLVGDLDDEAASTQVPACPEWSVHDVVAHMAGICTDIMAGKLAGAGTNDWTAAQVATRRDWKLTEILSEWDDAGHQIAAMLDDFPGWYGRQIIADVASHEHDLRGVLSRPGERDSEAVAIGIDFLVNVILRSGMAAFGLGPLGVKADDRSWIVGTGDPATGDREAWRAAAGSMDPVPIPESVPTGTLTVEPFELFRAIAGRRSASQIHGFQWSVDPEPYLPAFGYGPFTIRPTDLSD